MSKICIAIVGDTDSLDLKTEKELIKTAKKHNLACFFKMEYTEPFLSNIPLYYVVSVADSWWATNEEILADLTHMSLLEFGREYQAFWGR